MDLSRRSVLLLGAGVTVTSLAALAALADSEDTRPETVPDPLPETPPPTVEWTRPSGAGYVRYEDLEGSTLNARLNASQTRAVVTMPEGTFEQADFSQPTEAGPYGLVLWTGCAGIAGSGAGKTIVQLKPESSTKVGMVPEQSAGYAGPAAEGVTNPLKVLHAGETIPTPTGPRDVYLGGFTLAGTEQPTYTTVATPPDPQTGRGHNYNGIELYRAGKVVLDRLKVVGIPGSNGANPGETFSIMSGGGPQLDLTMTWVNVDGRRLGTGEPVGGSGIYHGGLTPKSSLTDVDVHHMGYGWGLAHYEVNGGTSVYTRVRSRHNVGAFNWERCSNHTFDLVQVDNLGSRATAGAATRHGKQPVFAVVDSDKGSVTINLRDVKVDDGTGRLVTPSALRPVLVVIHPDYWGSTQRQAAEDIHVFDAAGVEHPDWLVILPAYELDGRNM